MTGSDLRAIACNIVAATSIFGEEALCYVAVGIGNDCSERLPLLGRSRSGRWVAKWEAIWRVGNFRFKTIVPGNSRYGHRKIAWYADEGHLQSLVADSERERQARREKGT